MKRGKTSKYTLTRQQFKHKPRKVLNLEERVQAIRLYEREPIYQRVATALQCSWEQIKNVIANRRSILHYYVNCQTIADNDDERLVRRKKINFLGNLMHEYIKRAHHYRSAKLSDDVIRERALEFRDIIAIEKFYPNRAWVGDFKKTYNIDFAYMERLLITETPERSLAGKDIVDYCRKELDRTLALAVSSGESDEDEFDDVTMVVEATVHQNGGHLTDNDADDNENEALSISDNDDDDIEFADDEEGPTIDFGQFETPQTPLSVPTAASTKLQSSTPVANNSCESVVRAGAKKPKNTSISPPTVATAKSSHSQQKHSTNDKAEVVTFSSTTTTAHTNNMVSYHEALAWLRPLETFAVYEEDFHAMNLLSQLAQHYEASRAK